MKKIVMPLFMLLVIFSGCKKCYHCTYQCFSCLYSNGGSTAYCEHDYTYADLGNLDTACQAQSGHWLIITPTAYTVCPADGQSYTEAQSDPYCH